MFVTPTRLFNRYVRYLYVVVIAAIDPSLASAGHAVIHDGRLVAYGHGPLRTCSDVTTVVATLASYEPTVIAIENTFMSINAKTGIDLAELRGRLRQAIESRGIEVTLVAPSTWRKSTIKPPAKAKRKALKQMAIDYVAAKYGVAATGDEADAICIATHVVSQQS
jgi:Holliday junction resolvasome RuvABC endonuclease subunit